MRMALVTGGAGFIGTNLIIELARLNIDVESIDNYSTGKIENHQNCCSYITNDMISIDELKQVISPDIDVIFHLAADSRIQPSLNNPHKSIKNNIISTINILQYSKENNIKLIFAGSSTAIHPKSSPYAWSKYFCEELCKYSAYAGNTKILIARLFSVYGNYQIEDGTHSTVLGIFNRQYREKELLTITGTGNQRRDFIHVDDIVNGLISFANNNKVLSGEIIEFGSGKNYSINEIAKMYNTKTTFIPGRQGENYDTLADISKATELLSWSPKISPESYISETIKPNY